MKKLFISVVSLVALSAAFSSAKAVDKPEKDAPDVINIKMGKSTVPFQHKKHQVKMKNECFHCHKTKSGIIDNWNEHSAHVLCIACHDLYDDGPVDCKGCHTK